MYLATTNKAQRLLQLSYIQNVSLADLERGYAQMLPLLAEFPAGFRLLADLGRMESIDLACVDLIGRTMELMYEHGLELVVRVVPDPSKDIGFMIIAAFHYPSQLRIVTCQTMEEAARVLGL